MNHLFARFVRLGLLLWVIVWPLASFGGEVDGPVVNDGQVDRASSQTTDKSIGSFVLAGPNVKTVLIISPQWKPAVWYDWGGHAILQRYAKLVTGHRLTVLRADEITDTAALEWWDYRVWVGRQPQVNRVMGDRLDALDDDGYIIYAVGRDLYVSGKHWWGSNWAAHDLLERFAGCRWYLMEPAWWRSETEGMVGPGDIIPAAQAIRIPDNTDIVEQPDYKARWFRVAPMHSFRLRSRDKFHHAMGKLLPPDELFESHPEFYPLIDGRRYRPKDANDFQPCVSNEAMTQLVIKKLTTWFRQNPQAGSASIGMNDTNRYCHGDKCMAIAPPNIKGDKARIAYAYFDFYNRLAKGLAKTFPDKRLGCLAYAGLRALPPNAIKLHPMIVPYLTLDSAQLFEPDQQAEFRETIAKWNTLSSRMGIYEYIYGQGFYIPRIYNRYLLKNIKNRYGINVDGFYAEAYPNWGLDGPKYWLASRLLWDTSLDPDALLNEFYTNMFGTQANRMRTYFELLENTWCSQTLESKKSNYRWLRDPQQLRIFTPKVCEQAWQILTNAHQQAPNEQIRKRITFFRNSFALTKALSINDAHARAANDALLTSAPAPEGTTGGGGKPLTQLLRPIGQWLNGPDIALALHEARQLGFSAFSTTSGNSLDDRHVAPFVRVPHRAGHEAMLRLLDLAINHRTFTNRNAVVAAIRASARTIENNADKDVHTAVTTLEKLAESRGFVFVRHLKYDPKIDGRIDLARWGEPIFDGPFFVWAPAMRSSSDTPFAATSTRRTRIWAGWRGEHLYFAFDMQQDPALLGADVTDNDVTTWRDAPMRDDDTIVMHINRDGRTQHIRVNANGAWADWANNNKNWNVTDARVQRYDYGWRVEVKLSLNKLLIRPDDQGLSRGLLAFARYSRQSDSKRPTAVSTWLPFRKKGRYIGRGDHPIHMSFISGSKLVFEPAIAPAPNSNQRLIAAPE